MKIQLTAIYDYLFYKIYRYWRRSKSRKHDANIDAILTLSFSFICLSLVIFIYPLIFLEKNDYGNIDIMNYFKKMYFPSIVIYTIFNHIYFLSNKRYKEIFLKYVKESDEQKRKGNIWAIIFFIISLGTIPVFLFIYGSL